MKTKHTTNTSRGFHFSHYYDFIKNKIKGKVKTKPLTKNQCGLMSQNKILPTKTRPEFADYTG